MHSTTKLLFSRQATNIASLVTTTWGWSLTALFFFVVLAMGIYWHHPFYDSPSPDITRFQEFLPLIAAACLWLLAVAFIVHKAVSYGRRKNLTEGDFSHVVTANWVIFFLAAANTIAFKNVIGAFIAIFANGCLLVFCLIYLVIAQGLRVEISYDAYLSTAAVLLAIVYSWTEVLRQR
jgi:hypothetical protein